MSTSASDNEAPDASPGSRGSGALGEVTEIKDGSEDESGDASSDSETSDAGGLLDVMAVEGEETDESDDASSDNGDGDSDDDDRGGPPHHSFSKFLQLPFELRHRVWELFCPELRLRSRIFDFNMSPGTVRYHDPSPPATARVWTVADWLTLGDQTRSIRRLLSVHHESRALALKQFPDSLSIEGGSGDAIVRFDRDRDVVVIYGLESAGPEDVFLLPGFAEHVKHAGIATWDDSFASDADAVAHLAQDLSSLEAFFFCSSSTSLRREDLTWCTSDLVNRQHLQRYEEAPGLGEDMESLYAWPDIRNHADFARFQIPKDLLAPVPEPLDEVFRRKGVKTWPVVRFEFERGMRRYRSLLEPGIEGYETDSSGDSELGSESESGTDLDQYESDGIDDEEIVEGSDASDDEISIDGEPHERVEIGGDTPEAHFSSPEPESINGGAQFSSPEPESVNGGAHFLSPEPEPEPVNRGRKRRVVEDSDDDSDVPVRPITKRARTTHVVSSDSEDDDDQEQKGPRPPINRAARIVLSDSDSDAPEQTTKPRGVTESGTDESETLHESSEEDESDENGSSEDEKPAAPLSLAERLRLHREVHPIESSDDEAGQDDSDGEDVSDDENDGSDEEGRSRNSFFINMAEDEDEDEEDEGDDGENY
ncbi:hypothetical protein QQZ08_005060 [Neonectria magnoliae]|uniref:2EXR domain-containing protein n=1 Tax=Neonectria magnoliae TaxID=2732573 RepID=A0ABR1I4N4_9HYPO